MRTNLEPNTYFVRTLNSFPCSQKTESICLESVVGMHGNSSPETRHGLQGLHFFTGHLCNVREVDRSVPFYLLEIVTATFRVLIV